MRAKVQTWLEPDQPGHELLRLPPSSHQSSAPPHPPSSSDNNNTTTTTTQQGLKICILDGFLLYSPAMSSAGIMSLLDIKFFLLVSRAKATQRREARDGYVTVEGFWTDPPGYVDKIVWPNYVAEHKWLFENEDVDGEAKLDAKVLEERGIHAQVDRGADVDMETTFEWVVDTLMHELEAIAARKNS